MDSVFNSVSEISVRLLVILMAFNVPLDVQQLVYFDYLTLHFGDIEPDGTSLHPSNPFHAVEYVVKRRSIQNGLDTTIRKGLISVEYSNKGICYQANQNTKGFLECLESTYSKRLSKFANMVHDRFQDFTNEELSNFFRMNVGKWKGEFEKEVLFRGDYNE